MTPKQKVNRIAFAMERAFMINPKCLDNYTSENKIKFRKGLLQPRTRSLLLDSMYVWVKIGAVFCVSVNILRKNYLWSTCAKILGGYFIGNNVLPLCIFNVMEFNRIRLLKKQAWNYYYYKNENIDNIRFFLDPSTPISMLRNFSF